MRVPSRPKGAGRVVIALVAVYRGDRVAPARPADTVRRTRAGRGRDHGVAATAGRAAGDVDRSAHAEAGFALASAGDDRAFAGRACVTLSFVEGSRGEHEAAARHAEQALAVIRESGNEAWLPFALNRLGVEMYEAGDWARAAALFQAALDRWRAAAQPWGLSTALDNLAACARPGRRCAGDDALQGESRLLPSSGRPLGRGREPERFCRDRGGARAGGEGGASLRGGRCPPRLDRAEIATLCPGGVRPGGGGGQAGPRRGAVRHGVGGWPHALAGVGDGRCGAAGDDAGTVARGG